MQVSNALSDVDRRFMKDDRNSVKAACEEATKSLRAGAAIMYMDVAEKTSAIEVVDNGYKNIADKFKDIFSLIEQAISFLRRLFPVGPADVNPVVIPLDTTWPVKPVPVSPSPIAPTVTPGKKPNDIWGGFRQGPDGNCVTVSAIKAAMMRFGQKPTDIFSQVHRSASGYEVMMKDGFKLQLSEAELQMAGREAQFVGRDQEMLRDARFLFAVSAKRAQMENNDGWASRGFRQAIKTLNDGEHSREGLLRLGLKHHIKTVPLSALLNGMIGTIERRGHSVAVIGGVEELWGRRGGTPYRPEAITGLV